MQAKKYLVTGAAGFIGHKVCEMLLKDKHSVVGVDNLNDYYDVKLKLKRQNELEAFNNFEFITLDIENYHELENLFNKTSFDVVINLAARAGVRYSMDNPHVYMKTNAVGALNILELMRIHKIKKYVLASTSSLYEGSPMPFVETAPVNTPISPYAATKKAAEVMAYTYHHLYGIDVSVVRYFTVYGPMSRPDMAQLKFLHAIDKGLAFDLYGDGEQARDFTFVDDIARGTILSTKELGFEIINLGGGKNPVTVNHMISLLEKSLNKKAKINFKPFHGADMKTTWAQIDKAKKLLGWSPAVSFEEGIQKCVDEYMANVDFYRDLKF